MHRGYIKLWRKSMDSTIWQNHNLWRFWTYCLLKASHCDHTEMIGFQEVQVKTGEFVFGRKVASKETGLSERNIRTALTCLKSTSNIAIKVTNKFSIIRVQNWELYQESDQQIDQQSDQQLTSKRPANDQQVTTNKNVNNDKNDKNTTIPPTPLPPPGAVFGLFEQNYQRLTDKTAALLNDAIAEYSEPWVIDALNEGIERNKRSWKYVEAILKRWQQDGRGNGKAGRIPEKYHTMEELIGDVEPEESEVQG